jgi:hypothetical protein
MEASTNASVLHLTIVSFALLIFIARITDSSFLCARVVAAICIFTAGRTLGQPQNLLLS